VAAGCCARLWGPLADEGTALREGLRFICERSNRDVAALVLLKASGSTVWGAADIMYVRCACHRRREAKTQPLQ
jgi:hypothetical protein